MQVYTSVSYHYTEDPEFIQTECAIPEPMQLSTNSPQKVSTVLKLTGFFVINPVPRNLHVRIMCLGEEDL